MFWSIIQKVPTLYGPPVPLGQSDSGEEVVRVEVPAEQAKGACPKDRKTTLDVIIVWRFNYFAG